jgi:hypothetical protein
MPTANARYGRPKGTGREDHEQLANIAALLAANPKLKPTTAIRSLGVEDPSEIRRLRDKFRLGQANLMAEASRARRPTASERPPVSSNENTPAPTSLRVVETPPPAQVPPKTPKRTASDIELLQNWCELGFQALSAALENQSVFAQYWLRFPPVAMAVRSQLTCNAVAVAMLDRCKKSPQARLN